MSNAHLTAQQLEDIAAITNSTNGQDDPPPHGVAWLGEGRVAVHTEEGLVGFLVRDEENSWQFVAS